MAKSRVIEVGFADPKDFGDDGTLAEGAFIPLDQAIELGITEPEEAERLRASSEEYGKALDTLLRSNDIFTHKSAQAREKAKRLSVNADFQAALDAIRQRWGIVPHLPPDGLTGGWFLPDTVLDNYTFDSEPSDDQWRKLQEDIGTTLCQPFELDPLHDHGLVVAAVCYGLTLENIVDHWDTIGLTAMKTQSSGATLVLYRSEHNRALGSAMAIAYLAKRLHEAGALTPLPDGVREWVSFALDLCKRGRVSPSAAPIVIDAVKGRPNDPPRGDPELYLRIRPETTETDVIRTWPQVDMRKVNLWGRRTSSGRRIWRTYERDVELAELAEQCDDYDEVIREYDRRHPETPLAVDGIISDDTRDLVRQAVKRTKDRGSM